VTAGTGGVAAMTAGMGGVRSSTLEAIGGTPVVRLGRLAPEGGAEVLVKLEYFSPTGSYKDRMALAMIEGAERRGELRPGMSVVEFTGGSTGSSLAFVCAVKGYPLKLVSSDAFSPEKLRTMRAFGAELTIVPSRGGAITPDLFDRMREAVKEIVARDDAYWTDQFHNTNSLAGYEDIGRELLTQAGAGIDAFCGGVGVAGMLVGVSRALKEAGSATRIVALEPASSPFLSTGVGGPHRVEGIGTGIVPPLLTSGTYDEVRAIEECDARAMARRLAREEGIFAGVSTGLNAVAALRLAEELGPGRTVATVAVDTGLKYLAGDLYDA
jgi:cysteine synthase